MGKNKNKKNEKVESTKTPVVNSTATPTAAPNAPEGLVDAITKEIKGEKKPEQPKQQEPKTKKAPEKKVDKKPESKANSIPDADATVETPVTEEVVITPPTTKFDVNNIKLDAKSKVSGDGFARILDVAERRISKMKANEKSTIYMEQMLDYNLAWGLVKATIQAYEEKREIGLRVPNDEAKVNEIINTFNNLGVALAPHQDDDGQLSLKFETVKPETIKAVKEEKKIQAKVPETDPEKWTSEKEAQAGLAYILTQNRVPFPNRFNEALMKTRTYRKNQETDEAKKATWVSIGIGFLFKDTIALLGNKGTTLTRGLCQGVVSSLIVDHNPIFGHATVKYNLPMYSDKDIVDLVKAFIETRNDANTPIDDSLAVKNGILSPTREFFMNVPSESTESVSITDTRYNDICLAKKIMNKFYEAYKDEIPKSDPDFNLKATNKMIEIRNAYVDKDAAFALYSVSEYPKK